jgi:2-amino-4-hydroxy-6-hydroxymethyldihydropteridine diphosphokinase
MHNCFILLGSNTGNSRQLLNKAIAAIEKQAGTVIQRSSVYRTEAWGFHSPDDFLNMVIQIKTRLSPDELLTQLLATEATLGRQRNGTKGYSSRSIDIDILFYDEMILEQNHLTLPHPRLHLRRFTLVPMNEIAPEMTHPVFGKKMHELLDACNDKLAVDIATEKTDPVL